MNVCDTSNKSVALGSLGRPEVLDKQATMETKIRENARVVAVVLTSSHKFPKRLAREFPRSKMAKSLGALGRDLLYNLSKIGDCQGSRANGKSWLYWATNTSGQPPAAEQGAHVQSLGSPGAPAVRSISCLMPSVRGLNVGREKMENNRNRALVYAKRRWDFNPERTPSTPAQMRIFLFLPPLPTGILL